MMNIKTVYNAPAFAAYDKFVVYRMNRFNDAIFQMSAKTEAEAVRFVEFAKGCNNAKGLVIAKVTEVILLNRYDEI